MPANLPPQYFETERKLKGAKTIEERLLIYREMLSNIPKHKGTEKLQAEIKTKISKLNKELQKKPATRRGVDYFIPKEGAGQVVLVGAPNAGKSKLLNSVTNARSDVTDFPYATRMPVVGMMFYEDIQIQIVDMPSIGTENVDPWVFGIIRNADIIMLVADLSNKYCVEDIELVMEKLKEVGIEIDPEVKDAKKSILVGLKADIQKNSEQIKVLDEYFCKRFNIHYTSAEDGRGLDDLKRLLFETLSIIRVYTKAPGKPLARRDPVILKKGSTVLDAAEHIHKDFLKSLKYVRLWSKNIDGQRVERNYVLADQDVVEFHI